MQIGTRIGTLVVVLTIALVSCGPPLGPTVPDTDDGDQEPVDTTTFTIAGFLQKGPLVSGSAITIQELNDRLVPTGVTYETVTSDDFGSFAIESELSSRYVEVIGHGYYFDEVGGHLSSSEISLRAYVDLESDAASNLNVLTTMTQARTKALLASASFQDARRQAEQELLAVFNLVPPADADSFDELDFSEAGPMNGMLLAISAIAQQGRSVAQVAELLSKINIDLSDNGLIDTPSTIDGLLQSSYDLDQAAVRTNLELRYGSLGLTVEIPDFEDYSRMIDVVPPSVAATYPNNGDTDITVLPAITLDFSERVTIESLIDQVSLKDSSDEDIAITSSYGSDRLTVEPIDRLEFGADYVLHVEGPIVDSANNALPPIDPINFTTATLPSSDLALEMLFSGDFAATNGDVTTYGSPQLTTDRHDQTLSAFLLDGVDDYVSLTEVSGSFDDTTEFTISMWVKYDAFTLRSYDEPLLYKGDGQGFVGDSMFLGGDSFHFMPDNYSYASWNDGTSAEQIIDRMHTDPDWSWNTSTSPYVAAGPYNWSHIVVRFDGAEQDIEWIVNDEPLFHFTSIAPTAVSDSADPLLIGYYFNEPAIGDDTYNFFNGVIDDIRIYHRVLSDFEVNLLFLE